MELELATTTVPTQTKKTLTHASSISSGSNLKIEVGEAELVAIVPEGQTWLVRLELHVQVQEG